MLAFDNHTLPRTKTLININIKTSVQYVFTGQIIVILTHVYTK